VVDLKVFDMVSSVQALIREILDPSPRQVKNMVSNASNERDQLAN